MRLKEERITIIIEIISMFAIIISSVILQLAGFRISTYDNEKILLEIKRSEYIQLATYHTQKIHFYELVGSLSQLGEPLGKKAIWTEDPVAKAENTDEKEKVIMKKYKNGEITAYQFTSDMADYYREKTEHYKSRVNQVDGALKGLIKDPPKLFYIDIFFIKSLCMVVQLLGACIAVTLFLLLLRSINKRIVN